MTNAPPLVRVVDVSSGLKGSRMTVTACSRSSVHRVSHLVSPGRRGARRPATMACDALSHRCQFCVSAFRLASCYRPAAEAVALRVSCSLLY